MKTPPLPYRWWYRLGLALPVLLLFTPLSYGQIGWYTDPYAGINGVLLQPAASVNTPYGFDINLGELSTTLSNNYVYLDRASILRTTRDAMGVETIYYDEEDRLLDINGRQYSYDYRGGNDTERFARAGVRLLGPSFSVALGENWRVGLFTALRGALSMPGVDGDFSYPVYDGLPYGTQFAVEDQMQGATAGWAEVGLHLARAWGDGYQRSSVGVNLRYLAPLGGGYLSTAGDATVIKEGLGSIELVNVDMEFGFTRDIDPGQHRGFAIDLGYQTAWDRYDDGTYRWTVGVSVLDAGQLGFRNVGEVYRFTNPDTVSLRDLHFPEEFTGVESIDPHLEALQERFTGNREVQPTARSFNVLMPMAISGQVSFSPLPGLQFQAVVVSDIPLGERALQRGTQLSFIPRWSKHWYGAALPVSLFDGRQLNVGAQLRLGPLVLGTDRLLGTVLPVRRLDSTDFYVGLKVFPFGTGKRDGKTRGRGLFGGGRGGRGVECYEF
jgi:hypothetical protein